MYKHVSLAIIFRVAFRRHIFYNCEQGATTTFFNVIFILKSTQLQDVLGKHRPEPFFVPCGDKFNRYVVLFEM